MFGYAEMQSGRETPREFSRVEQGAVGETKELSDDGSEEEFPWWKTELEEIEHPLDPLPEQMYGVVIGSLIRDTADTVRHGPIKVLRIISVLVVFLIMLSLQVFLVVETKKLVTPEDVKNARTNYGKFEAHMYTDAAGVQHTYQTSTGYPRGVSNAYFNAANFATLDADVKSEICLVPMSNVPFLLAILWIWGLTVLNHAKDAGIWAVRILFLRTDDLLDSDGLPNEEALVPCEDGVEVKALPGWLKFVIVVFILLPKLLLCAVILWLGARWLTATLGFGDLLLNSVALAFIFELADLLYVATIPYHTKLLATRTLFSHLRKRERETCGSMFGLMQTGIVSLILALLYIYKFQGVLPEYKWDVADVCTTYLQTELAV